MEKNSIYKGDYERCLSINLSYNESAFLCVFFSLTWVKILNVSKYIMIKNFTVMGIVVHMKITFYGNHILLFLPNLHWSHGRWFFTTRWRREYEQRCLSPENFKIVKEHIEEIRVLTSTKENLKHFQDTNLCLFTQIVWSRRMGKPLAPLILLGNQVI